MKLAILLVALAACSVSRKTEQLACTSNAQCMGGRTCDRGYCVEQNGCPSACTSCDKGAMTCLIDCSGGSCGGVHCPDGFACTINCTGNGACNNVDCTDGTGCQITCLGNQACKRIDCGAAKCEVMCGPNGCNNLDCSSSCQCDVICPNGTCGTSCPMGDSTLCTQSGSDDTACSSVMPGCSHC